GSPDPSLWPSVVSSPLSKATGRAPVLSIRKLPDPNVHFASPVKARLADQGRGLVAERGRDRDARKWSPRLAVGLRRRTDLRQDRGRDAQQVQQILVPIERSEVHQQRPGRVGY